MNTNGAGPPHKAVLGVFVAVGVSLCGDSVHLLSRGALIMLRSALSLVVVVVGLAYGASAQVLVPNTSAWRFLHPTDGVDPAKEVKDFHTTFYTLEFDDSKWKTGKDKPGPHGGFGYGEEGFEGVDLGLPELENRKTAYLRLKFKTDKDYEKLVLKCQRDDGIIVYLDGKEVLRDNITRGLLGLGQSKAAYSLMAQDTIAAEDETKVNSYPLPVKLPAGEHILAISLHNRGEGSSDLRIAEISLEVASGGEAATPKVAP